MGEAVVGLIVVFVALLVIAAQAVRAVPSGRVGIVEGTGRYSRTLGAGRAIVVPILERVRALVDLGEQELDVTARRLASADGKRATVHAAIRFAVVDPVRATYELPDLGHAIEELTVATLRSIVGGLSLEDALASRSSIGEMLRSVLDPSAGVWGIRIDGAEIAQVDRENRGVGATLPTDRRSRWLD